MSRGRRFLSTIPGVVTGVAGLLTGVVGLITVLIQLGVIGGDDGDGTTASTTTTAVALPGGGGGAGATTTTELARFSVEPPTLEFKLTDPREKTVRVRNLSETAPLTLSTPRITGEDQTQFSVVPGTCNALRPGESCTLRVTFAPSAGTLRSYRAILQVAGPGGRVEEVRLTGTTLV